MPIQPNSREIYSEIVISPSRDENGDTYRYQARLCLMDESLRDTSICLESPACADDSSSTLPYELRSSYSRHQTRMYLATLCTNRIFAAYDEGMCATSIPSYDTLLF